MIKARCTKEIKDKQGNTIGYTVQDNKGHKVNFYKEAIKEHITNKKLDIPNLKVTSDGRIVIDNGKNKEKMNKIEIITLEDGRKALVKKQE